MQALLFLKRCFTVTVTKHGPFILLTITLIICIATYFFRRQNQPSPKPLISMAAAPAGGNVKIQTNRGEFDSEKWRGKKVFLYFGFLNCPHICPLTRLNLQRMLSLLPENERRNTAVVFISIDPERDTPAALAKNFKSTPENFFAGTASVTELREITKSFGAAFSVTKIDGTPYVEHSSLIYVINSKGEWAHALQYDSTPQDLVAAFNNADTVGPVNKRFLQVKAPQLLGKNSQCDAGLENCEITVDGNKFQLRISPSPIKTQVPLVIDVFTDSKNYVPHAIDFEGTNLNMGYIRPQTEKTSEGRFQAKVNLPICELEKMKWKATLLLTDDVGNEYALLFHFNTVK